MFTSHEKLKRKTPELGINREQFIGHLVDEFHTSTNIEAQEQVTANLANFAYDPINWNYLEKSGALQLFIQILSETSEKLQLHGLAGLCNICLWLPNGYDFVTELNNFVAIENHFCKTTNVDIVLNCITLFYQLIHLAENPELRNRLKVSKIFNKIKFIRDNSSDKRVQNISTIFIEEFDNKTNETINAATINYPTSNKKYKKT